jgi:uncharacterized protein YicC (UPF0701 family)
MKFINLEIYDLTTQPIVVSKMQSIYEDCLSWQHKKLDEKTNDFKNDIEKQAQKLIQAFKEETNKILKSKSKQQDLIALHKAEILESYMRLTNYVNSFYHKISKNNYYKYDVEKRFSK